MFFSSDVYQFCDMESSGEYRRLPRSQCLDGLDVVCRNLDSVLLQTQYRRYVPYDALLLSSLAFQRFPANIIPPNCDAYKRKIKYTYNIILIRLSVEVATFPLGSCPPQKIGDVNPVFHEGILQNPPNAQIPLHFRNAGLSIFVQRDRGQYYTSKSIQQIQ
jgi:hypothetical protein